jgi:phosphatidylglycerol:prolipoprotein diacylglycerol transferase
MEQELTQIFGQPLTRYGLGCALAMVAGLALCFPRVIRKKLGYETFIRLAVCVIPLAWLMARVFYVAADLIVAPIESSFYVNTIGSLTAALYFWDGGYSLMGALVGAILGAVIAEKWTGAGKGQLRDALALGLPAAILVERLCERGTGLGLGRTVDWAWLAQAPWCPRVEGEPVYPVYLLEAASALVLLAVMAILSLGRKQRRGGDLLRIFLFVFGLSQVLLESFRQDGHMVKHFVHISQVIAILLALAAMVRWSLETLSHVGHKAAVTVGWVITLACIGVIIWAEFGVDRWGNQLLAYGVMAACLAVIAVVGADFHIMANQYGAD